MVQASLKIPAPAPLRVRLSSNAKCGTTWDNGISLLADIDEQGKTLGRQVTLLILTPKPPPPRADEEVSTTPILGYQAEAWVSEQVRAPVGRPVETLRVKDILQN
jgi:hypothetical protein